MEVAEAVIVSKLVVYLLITLTGAFWGIIIAMLAWYLNMTYKLLMTLVNRVTLLESNSAALSTAFQDCRREREREKVSEDNKQKLEDLLVVNKAVQ